MPKYIEDAYLKEFVTKVISVKEGKFVVLEDTIFYPNSGGQVNDEGKLIAADGEVNVIFVGKFGGSISHQVEPENVLKEGDEVTCVLDWDRRYKLMRSHTAAHLISYFIEEEIGAKITGNQLGLDKCRIDFSLENFDKELLMSFESKVNALIKKGGEVESKVVNREEAAEISTKLSALAKGLPPEIKEVRLVGVKGLVLEACGGTHVKDIKEISKVKFIKFKNAGANNRRIYFEILDE